MTVDFAAIRQEYERAGLRETTIDPSPMRQLEVWLKEAVETGHPEPTAMTLATVSEAGEPSARIVLLKMVSDEGLGFFTNYDSDKGKDLAHHAEAAALLFWALLQRQVRVTGAVRKMSRAASESYFRSRPRESQLGAWASPQSTELSGRDELDQSLQDARKRFGEGEIPCPPNWGGYLISPRRVELWQGGRGRLHDRLRYTRTSDEAATWQVTRLAP